MTDDGAPDTDRRSGTRREGAPAERSSSESPARMEDARAWDALDVLFEAALERPPAEREAFLALACGDDPDLRDEVEALVEAAEAAEPWIESAEALVGRAAHEAFSEETFSPELEVVSGLDEGRVSGHTPSRPRSPATRPDPMRGRRIGPWRILRRLARGGMGDVYVAERADGQFEQRAALKVLRRGLDTDDILRRFLAERQILATLAHPNIARLLDGGATENGRPYLVLEYVEGEPITDYCDARRLGVADRLRLFATVCRAVQHAHRNLVLHRDLKPSNILVTPEGRVKLLDFGIAKLLDDSGPGPVPRTRTGMRLLTPEYASPEQVRGEPVTTATDVYQLGMLLYELLAGARPYEVRHRTPTGIERVVCEEEPEPPSERARDVGEGREGDRLRRRLRGDLDAVTLQALRKEPERRYASVAQLVEEVERHLMGLPVQARGESFLYRTRKFVRRRRWPLSAAAVLLALIVAWAAFASAQSARLARERDRARLEAAKAGEVKEFLVGLFEAADPAVTGGEEVTARDLVDEGARRVRQDLAEQPEVRADMLSALADVYWILALSERALSLAREALEIRESRFPEDSPEVAASLRQVALMTGTYTRLESTRRGSEVRLPLFRRAAEATRAAHGPRHPLYAQALHDWAMYGDHPPERRNALEDSAIAILRDAEGERARLAEIMAEAAHGAEPRERGLRLGRQALALRLELFGEEDGAVAASLSDLALGLEPTHPDSSERLLRRALEIHRAAAGPRHPTTLAIQNNLAGVLRDRGKYAEAVPVYREVLTGRHAEGYDPVERAYTQYGLAASLAALGRHREAEPLLRDALEVFPPHDGRHNATRLVLGRALAGQGRSKEAEEVLRSALATIQGGGDGPADEIRATLVELYEGWGRSEEAARLRSGLDSVSRPSARSSANRR